MFRKLCPPAYIYLIISIMFIFNILYVVLWTYILNLLCSTGKFGTGVSWFLILLPFLVLTLAMYMISNNFIDQIMKQ